MAGLAGIVNARAWYGVASSLAVPGAAGPLTGGRQARPIPIAPVAAVLSVALVIGVVRAGFVLAASSHAPGRSG